MNIKKGSDYSDETIRQLLLVSKAVLNKAELLVKDGPFSSTGEIWFNPVVDGVSYHLAIRKLDFLQILQILDESHASPPIIDPISFKLKIDIEVLRKYVQDLGTQQSIGTAYKSVNEINWPDYYRWSDDQHNFLVGDGRFFHFQKSDSKRWKVFNSLISRKGDWVKVSTISEETNIKDKNNVRVIVNQLINKLQNNQLSTYLTIEAKGGFPGAYRIVVPKA